MSINDKYKLEEQELNRRKQAARVLGLEIESDYEIVDEDFFLLFRLKKGDNVLKTYKLERDKDAILNSLNNMILGHQKQIDLIQIQIDKINATQ